MRWLVLTLSILLSVSAWSAQTIVLISGEDEYHSYETLPAFQKDLEKKGYRCIYLRKTSLNELPGLENLEKADLLITYIRRMTLTPEQLAPIKKYLEAGKPLVALRTSSHSFEQWKEFDASVLGGNYAKHHDNKLIATATVIPNAKKHPILKNVPETFVTGGSLYRTSPLASLAEPLLMGQVEGQKPEPMAWTHSYRGGKIFYTSLGHPKDFSNEAFRTLLFNAISWSLEK